MIGPVKSGFIGVSVGAVAVTIVFIILYFVGCGKVVETITIEKEVPGKPKIIYVPVTDAERQACIDSIINIKATMTGADFLLIEAADKCKSNSLGLDLHCEIEPPKNYITIQPVLLFTFRDKFSFEYGGQLSYFRNIAAIPRVGSLGFGGSVIATNKSAGLTAGVSIQF